MKIEVLFPEYCNLFGDLYNINYLEKCLPQAERVDTALTDEPLFAHDGVDLIYMGPMSERSQERVLDKLRPYRDRLDQLIRDGTAFLLTGNAGEIFGNCIENEDGSRIEGLGLLPLRTKRDMMHRHNSVFLGEFQGGEIMGFKSQFTMAWPGEGAQGLFPVKKGVGLNKDCPYEGLRAGNLFFTYLLGPVLLLNPALVGALLEAMGAGGTPLAFAPEMEEAYRVRLQDFHEKA